MHRIFALLTFESLVLIAGLFLFAWIRKNEMNKWLQYMAASITIFIAILMIGSVFTCCMPCWGMNRGGCGSEGHGMMMKDKGCMMNQKECKMDMDCSKGEMEDDCCMMQGGSGHQMGN